MMAKEIRQVNLIAGGKDEWENTDQYKDEVAQIAKAVREKYSQALLDEKNWIKSLLIRLRLEIEIRNKIHELSSSGNLHIGKRCTLWISVV